MIGRRERELQAAYADPATAADYAQQRWRRRGHARRTDRRERAILAAYLERCRPLQRVLDVPCGAGRFAALLAARAAAYYAADLSRAMLAHAPGPRLQAAAARLPLCDASFDLVLCLRLLHHFEQPQERVAVLRELARVGRRYAVVSWYDRASLPALRHRLRGRRRARFPIAKAQFAAEAETAGWRIRAHRHVARGLSEQVISLLEKPPEPRG